MARLKPNISIIVPIYNVEPYLRRCVDSLLKQSYEDFELILVDDGSPDNCGPICDEYAAADDRVRVIHKLNGGLSDARNAGLKISQGEYIAFVDSDDWVTEDYLRCLLTVMLETGSDICECEVLRTSGEEATATAPGTAEVFDATEAMAQLIYDGTLRQHVWNKLYRRDIIADILFPKGKTNEDEFWTYQVFGNAKQIVKIDTPLYMYFQRSDSIMGQSYSLKRLDALEAKSERQQYVNDLFPCLSTLAKKNLFGSCIYAGQMSLLYLRGDQRIAAKAVIKSVVRDCAISLRECVSAEGGNKVWFLLAYFSFWGTCRLKNLLKKGI